MFSYQELVMKYGPSAAYQCLIEIEKAARIAAHEVADINPEIRLNNAIRAQDALAEQKVATAA